ncbi:aaa-family atpase [Anaeramoeba flamelloides]|uniref:Aaa-family atpase n=1 Tax=Anaeramoeba flamelloides TaxID=1746091 RepID=A0ABQ8X5T2_9EUKA|nr:aaa-family atpase [Anaeramoeba flamelloides]
MFGFDLSLVEPYYKFSETLQECKSITLQTTDNEIYKVLQNLNSTLATLLCGKEVELKQVLELTWFQNKIKVLIKNIEPVGIKCQITNQTTIKIERDFLLLPTKEKWIEEINNNFGGYKGQIEEIIEKLYDYQDLPFVGLLLHGSSGTGKTYLMNTIAKASGLPIFKLDLSETFKREKGQVEKYIASIFLKAKENSPCFFLIDQIEAFAPCYESSNSSFSDLDRAVLYTLIESIDEIANVNSFDYFSEQNEQKTIYLLATTEYPQSVSKEIRECGRIDFDLEIQIPQPQQRIEILNCILKWMGLRLHNNQNEENILQTNSNTSQKIIEKTHSFVGSDLKTVCDLSSQKQILLQKENTQGNKNENGKILNLTTFLNQLEEYIPSSVQNCEWISPNISGDTKFDDLGGMDSVIQTLKTAVLTSLKSPEKFDQMGIEAPRGVLIYGKPGSGKTKLVQAIANESSLNLVSVKCSEILSKVLGRSEERISQVFLQASAASPCILFLDHIETIAAKRQKDSSEQVADRILTCLLTEMDGISKRGNFLVVGVTDRIQALDEAILRPGRFDLHIKIPDLDSKGRLEILLKKTKKMPLEKNAKEYLDKLAKDIDGFSGADIESMCKEAAYFCMRRDLENGFISIDDLEKAKQKIQYLKHKIEKKESKK